MLFWAIAVAMVATAAAVLLRAGLKPVPSEDSGRADMAVYRAQLSEAERDLARGIIGDVEADQLKTEIARRILDRDRLAHQTGASAVSGDGLVVPAVVIVALLAGAFGLYQRLGAAGFPDVPHDQRVENAEALRNGRPSQTEAEAQAAKTRPAPAVPSADYAALMDQLRAAVSARPDDVEGLRLLARNERALGNLSAAAAAQAQLVKALGDGVSAEETAALVDLYVNAAGGEVTAEAEAAIATTLRLDPANGTARYYAGLLEALTGRPDRAFALWRDLLADSPEDAPWVPVIRDQIGYLALAAGVDYALPAAKGPDAADVTAAAAMSAADRAQMIAGMVDGLEARLAADGGSAEEWAQLLTALGMLHETDRARAAWDRAQAALAGDAAGLDVVRAAATTAGVAE